MNDDLLLELVFLRYFYDSLTPILDNGGKVKEMITKGFEFDTGHETPEGYRGKG